MVDHVLPQGMCQRDHSTKCCSASLTPPDAHPRAHANPRPPLQSGSTLVILLKQADSPELQLGAEFRAQFAAAKGLEVLQACQSLEAPPRPHEPCCTPCTTGPPAFSPAFSPLIRPKAKPQTLPSFVKELLSVLQPSNTQT